MVARWERPGGGPLSGDGIPGPVIARPAPQSGSPGVNGGGGADHHSVLTAQFGQRALLNPACGGEVAFRQRGGRGAECGRVGQGVVVRLGLPRQNRN